MAPEEFRELYKRTPNSNKALKSDRNNIVVWMSENKPVYIYRGGKMLNAIDREPIFNKTRFVIKPIIK